MSFILKNYENISELKRYFKAVKEVYSDEIEYVVSVFINENHFQQSYKKYKNLISHIYFYKEKKYSYKKGKIVSLPFAKYNRIVIHKKNIKIEKTLEELGDVEKIVSELFEFI